MGATMDGARGDDWDVVIVGGGPAGMSAALVLGRARKRVLMVDAARPRHAVADGVHNLLGREGVAPAELRRIGRAEIAALPTTREVHDAVARVDRDRPDALVVHTAGGARHTARALVLAVGVEDVHPELPGFAAKWGGSIHLCPYCHGYEARDQPIGVLGGAPAQLHKALLLRGWSDDVILFTDGGALTEEQRAQARAGGLTVREERVVALEGEGRELHALRLADGQRVARSTLFVDLEQRPLPLVRDLELALDDGVYLAVDPMTRATSDPRIYAAGDCTTRMQAVVMAMGAGLHAAGSVNAALTLPALT